MKRWIAVGALAILAAGCAGGDGNEDSGIDATSSPSSSVPASDDEESVDISAVPSTAPVATVAEMEPAGTLSIGFATGLQTFDPAQAGVAQITYLRPVFDSLFAIDPVTGSLTDGLVEEYDLDSSSMTLHLREGVVFSDGSPLDADVVAANLERTRGLGGAASAALARVDTIEASSPTEVSITLAAPSPTLPRDLAGLAGMMMSGAALEDPDVALRPVGSGPWTVQSVAPGDRVVYEISSTHWDSGAAGVERIEILELPDNNARSNALMTGQVDMAQLVPPQLATVEQAGFDTLRFPDVFYGMLVLDRDGTLVPALGDPRVREALQYAIDRNAIIDHVFFGAGTASAQPYPDGRVGHSDALAGANGFDPDRARSLLEDAGFAEGFTLKVPAIAPTQPLVEAIAGYLAEVGITIEIEVLQPGTLAAAGQSGDYASFVGPGLLNDPLQMYATYFSPTAVFNPFGVPIPGVDELASQLAVSADDAERSELAAEMMDAIVADGAMVTVGIADLLVGSRSGTEVPGWQSDPFPELRGIRVES